MEQLHDVRLRGRTSASMTTAPQWQLARIVRAAVLSPIP
jgi:hypothetical protein